MPARRQTPSIFAAGLLTASFCTSLLGAPVARASDRAYDFNLPPSPLPQALMSLAARSGISIGGVDPVQCEATVRPLKGRFSANTALRKLVVGSRCRVERIDAVTFRLVRETRATQPRPVAGPTPPPSNDDIPLIVVRHPSRLFDTPAGVSVVAPPLLSGNDTDLSSLAPHVAGMTVTNLGPGRDKIFLRGVSDSVLTGRTQSMVGLYLDDTPITYNAPDPDLLLVDMAHLEVLKGPQGNLYGQGALSGVVRLVTNKPQLDHFEAEAGVALGTASEGKPSWRTTGMINLPLPGEAALRAVIWDEKSAGFIKDEALTKNASNDTERSGGRFSFKWQATPTLTLDSTVMVQDLRSSNSQYVVGRMGPYRRALSLAEPHDNIFQNLALGLTRDTSSGTWRLALNRLSHKIHSGYDAQPIGRYVTIPNSGVLFFEEDQTIRLSSVEASYVSPPDRPVRWLAGVFAARSEESFTPLLIDVFTRRTLYDEDRSDRIDDVAAFAKVTWDFAPKWSLSVGLRAQRSRHRTLSDIARVRLVDYAQSGRITGVINATPVTHELMLSYQPSTTLMLYALSSDGFRTGGFNTTTAQKTIIPATYEGDRLHSIEAGLKYRAPDGRLRVDAALYNIEWRDIQSDQLRATGLPVTLNIGDGRNTGIELEGGWRPFDTLTMQVRTQFSDPNLYRTNPVYPKVLEEGMPYISPRMVSLSTQWRRRLWRLPFENAAVLSYRDGSPLNYGITRVIRMKGYTNLDLSSSADLGPYTIALRVTNATGNKSNSFAYGNPFALDTAPQNTPLRPRTLWLSVNRHF
ncbi:TonB-dependent receptor [Asticcacaulis excentricus CB 48]|uniref:TonB-dependent receptor n=1 Tax=Asticcacaulis excentricus (strain ATCC 15261 / DSM 4724 / KCTC 12464 / NCIMB 9791 / VKM B-1370 / CB 48) TaxID=573065 RepID=E8RUD6_ASTEC|nr:TonB-dependent receptor [Asticcacaulis excentricus CB 48]